MADNGLRFEVITPERVVLRESVEFVAAPAVLGELGVMHNHAPLITGLKIGVIKYTKNGQRQLMAVSGGFMEVNNNRVTVLADTAELAPEIDVQRALSAKERAQDRLQEKRAETDVHRAEMALQRALSRLKAAEREKESLRYDM
jgi:F-type H+-transporting ATPase subunit epsilon